MKNFLTIIKKGFTIIVITALVFTACNRGKSSGSAGYEALPAGVDINNYDGEITQADKIKDRIAEELARSSDEEYYKTHPQQIAHNVTFKNQKISMTVFYHYDEDSRYYITEKIVFDYDGARQTLEIPGDWYPYYSIGEDSTYNIDVDDFNFDGFMDIAVFAGTGNTTFWNNYFIYNPKAKRYEYHEKMSGIPNIFIDEKNKTLSMHTNDGYAGMMYTNNEYKWINGELTLIHKENQNYDTDNDIYIRTIGILQNNGAWEEKIQQFTEAQILEEFGMTE